jgi:hypothetical protein
MIAHFSLMMCRRSVQVTATVQSESEVLSGEVVSGNYFPMLGVHAAIGRVFQSDDDLYFAADDALVPRESAFPKRKAEHGDRI